MATEAKSPNGLYRLDGQPYDFTGDDGPLRGDDRLILRWTYGDLAVLVHVDVRADTRDAFAARNKYTYTERLYGCYYPVYGPTRSICVERTRHETRWEGEAGYDRATWRLLSDQEADEIVAVNWAPAAAFRPLPEAAVELLRRPGFGL